MKKVVVIGGSGFIGSHVADYLSEAGYQVIIYDSNYSPWLSKDQEMVVGDLLDEKKLNQTIMDAEFVYNFAALADLNESFANPQKTISINILGNMNVMESCRLNNVKRFIFASTIYVNSREGGFYRCSKQASESYVKEYQRVFGLDYTIIRYGSLYGPRSDESNGIFRIIKSALETGVVKYEGHKESMREYIHVMDAALSSIEILDDKYNNKSIVLTGLEPMRVIDVLKMLAEILGISEDNVEFVEGDYIGHYVRSPYSYQSEIVRKLIPPMHIDLGQGMLQLINEIEKQN
jgi:UDP-glucose 4-epimerase